MQIKNISLMKLALINILGFCFWYTLIILYTFNSHFSEVVASGIAIIVVGVSNYIYLGKSNLKHWKKLILSSIFTVIVILTGYYAIMLSSDSISEDAAYSKVPYIN